MEYVTPYVIPSAAGKSAVLEFISSQFQCIGENHLLENDALSELHMQMDATKWGNMMITLVGST
jgi:hypothetical protein